MAAAGRLTFLYPQLVRVATRGCGPTLGRATSASTTTTTTNAATTVRWNSLISKRHGKAVEPAEWEKQQQQQLQQQKQQEQDEQTRATQDKTATAGTTEEAPSEAQAKSDIGKLYFETGEKKVSQAAAADAPEIDAAALKSQQQSPKSAQTQAEPKSPEPTTAESEAIPMGPPKPQTDSSDSTPTASAEPKTDKPKDTPKMSDKLDSVYYMGAPDSLSASMPSMSPPKYVHHFDSYSLVKQLQEGGYSNDQAITLMKAVRAILAHNLDVAQEKLVSKSDVENESYLFSAACSELSAEINNNRRAQDEQIRQQRTHLQHEVDILTQTLNQELLTLNDNVRGLFNDRKMTVREEQKGADSAIQQITYKISIMLSSDSKSEIEGVRWILIRRSVVGILFMAIVTLGTIRYATYVGHERQREQDRKKKEAEELRRDGGKNDRTSAPDAAAILAAN
ncbi:uncharacterized protein C27B12.07 [Trichoderma asperellum]|uniref:Uncharacterized protein C27B12.07 n=1 Tax=Trichoderma asperellum TaxID=101201 RepID=A0A6V8QNN6_TRIAP|nr:hypothetical protein LI328DRAFT_129717 [Trichoderma asperelloides]GFP52103.1 uncharacterized protein C27B12.07 [Trichoderma asperellum]